jgi:2-polyprenyl-3-methyl-5-hydroxy-6-metoxy-1,4-benzoquinol methylase
MTDKDPILDANMGWNTAIDNYLLRPFHIRRVNIAMGMLRDAFNKSVSAGQKPRGIELGSSGGEVAVRIRDMGADIIACDAEEEALVVAREKHGLETKKFDVSQPFPFKDNSLDFIYAGELIEHLFDTRKFLAECNRVLKPEGTLVLTTPNLATLRDRFRFFAGNSPRQVNPMHRYLWLHIRPFTAKELKKSLQEAGFGDTSLKNNVLEIPLPRNFGKHVKSKLVKKLLHKIGVREVDEGRKQLESTFLAKLFPTLGGSLITASHKKTAPAIVPAA